MARMRIVLCAMALFGAGCGHLSPAQTQGVPPPWPAPDPPVIERAQPSPPPPAQKPKPPVPPLKQDVLPPATPTPPRAK